MFQRISWCLLLLSACYAFEIEKGIQRRPFAKTENGHIRVVRQTQRFYPNDAQIFRQRPLGYDPSASAEYPVVLTPRTAFRIPENRLEYRPEPLVTPYQRERPLPRRPVIAVDPQQLPYGKPYLRVPYDERAPRRLPLISRNNAPRRRPEFGPFGPSGPFSKYPEIEPELISEDAFPSTITSPYAPTFQNYIPSLYFRHNNNPTTGEYDVEYETANGIYQKENGYTKRVSYYNPVTRIYDEKATPVKTGQVSWTSPEGIRFSFEYVADENGYRPTPLIQSPSPPRKQYQI